MKKEETGSAFAPAPDYAAHLNVRCPKCSASSVFENGRGWWCVNTECSLSKKKRDTKVCDKYRPDAKSRNAPMSDAHKPEGGK